MRKAWSQNLKGREACDERVIPNSRALFYCPILMMGAWTNDMMNSNLG